jgi:hypothetical protein
MTPRRAALPSTLRSIPVFGLVAAAILGSCIIPDRKIGLQEVYENPGRVRIIQPVAMTPEADEACADASELLLRCPLPESNTIPFGLIDLPQQQFCVCAAGERDGNALAPFEIFVEDPDLDEEQRRRDLIFGALLLDPSPQGDPSQFVAYENYLDPSTPAFDTPLLTGTYGDAIERPTPLVRGWAMGGDRQVDLCNQDNAQKLEPGLHELRIIVTDRPWYVPVELDGDGDVQRDADGSIVRRDEPARIGVPDLPGGATYDTATYVFRCGDGRGAATGDSACSCIQEE